MEKLQQWTEAQFAQHLVEPNSGLGKAITYFLRHWKGLTAFLREAGANAFDYFSQLQHHAAELAANPTA